MRLRRFIVNLKLRSAVRAGSAAASVKTYSKNMLFTNEKRGKRQVSINQDPNYKRSATVMLTCSNHGRKKDAHIIFSKVPAKKDKANTLGSKMLLRRNQHFIFQKTLKFMQLHLDGVNRYVLETWHQEEFSKKKVL